jgi:hypothetical protein
LRLEFCTAIGFMAFQKIKLKYQVKKMNISQEKVDNLNTVVKININPEDYQPRVEKAMKDQR